MCWIILLQINLISLITKAKLSNSFWIDFITKTSSVLALQQPLTQLVLCSSNVSITGLLCGAEYTVVSIVVSWQDAIQSRKHKGEKQDLTSILLDFVEYRIFSLSISRPESFQTPLINKAISKVIYSENARKTRKNILIL